MSIDPFSTEYWADPKPKTKPTKPATKPTRPAAGDNATLDAFVGDGGEKKKNVETAVVSIPNGLAHEDVLTIKRALKTQVETVPRISKVGVIEYLKSSAVDGIKVRGKDISTKDLKEVVDALADRKGKGKDITWTMKPGFDL